MKGFVIAMLAAAAALLLAALLWPDRPPSAAERKQHLGPIAAAVDTREVEQVQQHHDVPAMPPRSAVSVERAAAISYRESTDGPRRGGQAHFAPKTPQNEPVPDGSGVDPKLSTSERMTLAQTATTDTSLRNADYPRTYIRAIQVDLTSPDHSVRLTWSGPQAASQETGPFHSSPGRGLGNNNCDDLAESNRQDSNCTPKGTFRVQGFSNTMPTYSHCKFVTWFLLTRGIGFHSYPGVADYPASHGCVRLDEHAARLIHNNAKIGATEVTVGGKWTFGR